MTLSKRLERLEGKRGQSADNGPCVVFIYAADSDEPGFALVKGGGTITPEPGETREAFEARAMAGAPAAIHLPDNGRALVPGEAPQWAQSALVLRKLREKHGDGS